MPILSRKEVSKVSYDTSIRVNASVDSSEIEKKLIKNLDKAENKVDSLREKAQKLETLGIDKNGRQWKSLIYDIEQAEGALYAADEALKNFRQQQDGISYMSMGDSLKNAALKIKDAFRHIGSAIIHPKQTMVAFSKTAKNAAKAIMTAFRGMVKVMSAIIHPLRTAKNALAKFGMQGKKTGGIFSTMKSRLKGITLSLLIFNWITKGFNAMVSSFREGFQNIARYSSETNKVMSDFKSQTAQLKNSLATAFTPVINSILPALTAMVSWLNKACDSMARFMAFMSGKKTYTKAKEQAVDYAKSLDKASGAAKKASKTLAAFDELNVLSDNDSSSGGSGGTNVSDMFEEVNVGEMSDFSKSMKEAIEKGDWYGAGELLAKKINEMLKMIDFHGVDSEIQKKIKGVVDGLNGFVEHLDWPLLGKKMAEALNILIHSLETFLKEFNWKALGKGLVSGIAAAFASLDYRSIAGALSTFVIGVVDFLTGAIQGIDWAKVPDAIIKAISDFLEGVDWAGMFVSIGGLIGAAAGGLINLSKGIFDALAKAWDGVVKYFSDYIEKSGGDIVLGLFKGIVDALKSVGKWIVDNIFNPFIEGFKSAFEIHSPSKVMYRMGKYLIDGLLSGIKEIWKGLKKFFSESFSNLKTSITNNLNGIIKSWTEKFDTVKTGVYELWKGIKTNISNSIESIKKNISAVFTGKSGIVGIWNEAWNSVKKTTVTIFGSIWKKIRSILNSILNGIGKMLNGGIDAINGFIGNINKIGFDLPNGTRIGFNIPKMKKINLPQLADGAVIKGGNPFMAILGDQRAGQTNIETPLSTMIEAFKMALSESEMRGGDITFVAQLDGQTLFKETLRQAEFYKNRTGKTIPI